MFKKIETKKRSHLAAEMLIQVIQAQKLEPGDKLPPERIIAKEMGLSRNTLREAIAALQIMGILEARHSQGNFVLTPIKDQHAGKMVHSIFSANDDPFMVIDARIAFEPGAACLSSRVSSEADFRILKKRLKQIQEALTAGELTAYLAADLAFHLCIAHNTQNLAVINTMVSLIQAMKQPLWRTMKQGLTDDKTMAERLKEHQNIYHAIVSREETDILESVQRHLENSKQRFLSGSEEWARGDT